MGAEDAGSKKSGATVVIHVGPPKTATTTVQGELFQHAHVLAKDGWTYLRARQFGGLGKGAGAVKNQVANVAMCYTGKTHDEWSDFWQPEMAVNQTRTCLDWIEYIDHLRDSPHNVVMSSEWFSLWSTRIAQLASDLSHVATKIVVVYRPFYDWIASVYRQRYARSGVSKVGFALWLTDSMMEGYATHFSSTSVYSRYEAHFSDVVMHTLNSSLLTTIACDDLGAPRACKSFQKAEMVTLNVKREPYSQGECLSPAQLRTLESISIEMHRKAFGIFEPFPASDFHDQVSSCFGNR